MPYFDLDRTLALLSVLAGLLTSIVAIWGAFRAGVLRRVRIGSVEFEAPDPKLFERIKREIQQSTDTKPLPFEIEQLAGYYSQVLGQAKTSFWFSLIFASFGF